MPRLYRGARAGGAAERRPNRFTSSASATSPPPSTMTAVAHPALSPTAVETASSHRRPPRAPIQTRPVMSSITAPRNVEDHHDGEEGVPGPQARPAGVIHAGHAPEVGQERGCAPRAGGSVAGASEQGQPHHCGDHGLREKEPAAVAVEQARGRGAEARERDERRREAPAGEAHDAEHALQHDHDARPDEAGGHAEAGAGIRLDADHEQTPFVQKASSE